MLRHLLSFLAIAALLTACSQKNSFHIKGSVEQINLDNRVLYLSENKEFTESVIDSAVVRNGKFTFKGVQDEPAVYFLYLESDGNDDYAGDISEGIPLFVQPGTITVEIIGNKTKIGGNSDNKAYQDLQNKQYDIMSKMKDLADRYEKSLTDSVASFAEKAEKSVETEADELNEKLGRVFYDYLAENINSPMGEEYFRSHYDYLTNYLSYKQLDSLLSNANKEFREDDDINNIIQSIESEKKIESGQKFSDFMLPNDKGKQVSLSDFMNKKQYVLVEFWASWNSTSLNEIRHLKGIYDKYHAKNLEIVGVSLDDIDSDWKSCIANLRLKWPQLIDTQSNYAAAQLYKVTEIPTSILFDAKGVIVARNITGDELTQILDK
ncbi:MAG: AhpC/TSA family protein [Dysgonamonadaceae bacterium]|jgi:peroxiredoxin|nr:AhpC/TSA family protein [Dysgonamonadaceae bacterium]